MCYSDVCYIRHQPFSQRNRDFKMRWHLYDKDYSACTSIQYEGGASNKRFQYADLDRIKQFLGCAKEQGKSLFCYADVLLCPNVTIWIITTSSFTRFCLTAPCDHPFRIYFFFFFFFFFFFLHFKFSRERGFTIIFVRLWLGLSENNTK